MTLIRLQKYELFSILQNNWAEKSVFCLKIFFFGQKRLSLRRKIVKKAMQIRVNPLGRMINEFLMKWALPLGLYFIVEYWVRNASTTNVMLGFLTFPLMLLTPVALWWILRRLRQRVMSNMLLGIQAWSFGVQLMFFAGLIEALFIYVFNQFLSPNNLMDVQQAAIAQYQEAYNLIHSLGTAAWLEPTIQETLQTLQEAPVPSAIDAAITALSNDIFIGMMLMIPIAFIVRRRPK